MSSRSAFDAETFNPPLPTAADVAALERATQNNTMSPADYLEFLRVMNAGVAASRETNTDSDEPFTLP